MLTESSCEPEYYSAEYVRAMEQHHAKERDENRTKIASLESHVDTIHAEFIKNKKLLQMLINKVEADQRLIEQANDLRLSLTHSLSANKESRAM